MTILGQVSSQVGDRTAQSNRKVAALCLAHPAGLAEIAQGLSGDDAALLGDCAEVFTMVAEQRPDLVAPHAEALTGLLRHKTTRVRWEAMHGLALVAVAAPTVVADLLLALGEQVRTDSSVIVRDYGVDAIGNYARTGTSAAQRAFPLLREALSLWRGKHAGRALKGLANVAAMVPELRAELRSIGEPYWREGQGVVRKAARELAKATEPAKG